MPPAAPVIIPAGKRKIRLRFTDMLQFRKLLINATVLFIDPAIVPHRTPLVLLTLAVIKPPMNEETGIITYQKTQSLSAEKSELLTINALMHNRII